MEDLRGTLDTADGAVPSVPGGAPATNGASAQPEEPLTASDAMALAIQDTFATNGHVAPAANPPAEIPEASESSGVSSPQPLTAYAPEIDGPVEPDTPVSEPSTDAPAVDPVPATPGSQAPEVFGPPSPSLQNQLGGVGRLRAMQALETNPDFAEQAETALRAQAAADAEGRLKAVRATVGADMGAYLQLITPGVPLLGAFLYHGLYDVPLYSFTCTGVFTNLTPTDAYRGAGRPEATYDIERAMVLCSRVGILDQIRKRADQLSGGQRQRVGIARALMQDAEIILADEPVSNLDPELAEEALGLLIECVARRGETLLVNLHQPSLARRFATRIIGLSHGRIVYDGSPDGFTEEAAEFLYQAGGQSGQALPIPGAAGNGA